MGWRRVLQNHAFELRFGLQNQRWSSRIRQGGGLRVEEGTQRNGERVYIELGRWLEGIEPGRWLEGLKESHRTREVVGGFERVS